NFLFLLGQNGEFFWRWKSEIQICMFVKKKVRGKNGRFSADAENLPLSCSSCAMMRGTKGQVHRPTIDPFVHQKRRLPAFMQKAFSFAQGQGTCPLIPLVWLLLGDGG